MQALVRQMKLAIRAKMTDEVRNGPKSFADDKSFRSYQNSLFVRIASKWAVNRRALLIAISA